jgi:ubiquinone/menaquinone biosynthesis C-methylase UbiE
MTKTNKSTTAWDTYWADNTSANSFAFDYSTQDGPYGVINRYWQDVFATFDESQVIVDLGAGNGALASLFVDSRKTLNCKQWLNIDSAKASKLLKRKKIKYLQDDMNQLQLKNNSVDHIISMFGLEYADFSQSLLQIKRCLRPYGRFHFVMHHKDAVISIQSRITIDAYKAILASNLLVDLSKHANKQSLQQALLTNLHSLMAGLSQEKHDDIKLVGQSIYGILQNTHDLATALDFLSGLKQQLVWHSERLQQQLDAANKLDDIEQYLQTAGITEYTLGKLNYESSVLAWCLEGVIPN